MAVLAAMLGLGPAMAGWPEDPPAVPQRLPAFAAPPPHASGGKATVVLPRAGDRDAYGLTFPPALAEALAAVFAGDAATALAALDRLPPQTDGLAVFTAAKLRVQAMVLAGRAAEAVDSALAALATAERARFGDVLETPALEAELRLWLDQPAAAEAAARQVLKATADFRVPTSFTAPPPDMPGMVRRATAQIRALVALAALRLVQDQPAEALAWALEAESRLADVHAVASHPLYGLFLPAHADSWYGRGVNAAVLGAAALAAGRPPAEAEAAFVLARDSFAAVGYRAGPALIALMRASGLRTAGRLEEAAVAAETAAATAAAVGVPDLAWRASAVAGAALFDRGRPAEAEPHLRTARLAMEAVTGALGTDQARRRFGVGAEDVTRRLVAIDRAKNDLPALFEDLERGRARAFVALLGSRAPGGTSDAAAQAVAAVRVLDGDLRALRLRLAAPGEGAPPLAEAEILAARRAEAVAALRVQAPEQADLLAVTAPALPAVQAALPEGAVLAYGLPGAADEPMAVLLVSRDGARIEALPVRREALETLTRALAEPATLTAPARQIALAADLRTALAPLAALGKARRLYVVPSGPLHRVPWGMLDLTVPVSVLPTAGWLLRPPAAMTGKPAGKAVVVGDPLPATPLALPGARAEAVEVARLLGGGKPFLGGTASARAVRAAVGEGVAVLHLATHGRFDADDPLASAVLLAGEGAESQHWLSAAELFETPLAARLVVLSACETGAGRAEAGDDFLGLPRSFYLGGARAVLASLWPVEDEGTRLFMTTFHAAAKGGDWPKAWVKARDAVRKAGYPPSVYGAFVLGGG